MPMISSAHKTLVLEGDHPGCFVWVVALPGAERSKVSRPANAMTVGAARVRNMGRTPDKRGSFGIRLVILTHRPVRGHGRGSQHKGVATGHGPVAARFRGAALRGAP